MQPCIGGATAARFDLSGLYLAVGGTEARVVGAKQDWAQLTNLSGAIGNKVFPLLSTPVHALIQDCLD